MNTAAAALTTTDAAALAAGDLIHTGHGFGEKPAFVVRVAPWTAGTVRLELTDGPDRTRTITARADAGFERAPRAGEAHDGLQDYDTVRDLR